MPRKLEPDSKATQKLQKSPSSSIITSTNGKAKSKVKSSTSTSKAKTVTEKLESSALESASVSASASGVEEEAEEEDSDEEGSDEEGNAEDEDDEDDGVDEEGMKKLMKALGEDGLDEVGRMQLDALEGGSEGSEEEDDEEEEEEKLEEEEEESGEEESGLEPESNIELQQRSQEQENGGDEEEEEEEVALDDAESVDEDVVPRQKIITNNKIALERIRDSIKLDPSLPWTETLTVTYPERIDVDVNDDLKRELVFYKQALHGATTARTLASQHSLPFTRPADYFAEMVKSDAHMERIRQRLLDESAQIKRAEEKRKEREGKKYGKQVQIEKMKERERSKKEMEERLRGLKRKHKDALPTGQADDSAFDVAVEDAISDRPHPSKRAKPTTFPANRNKLKLSRKARDTKFGFGGKGRRDRQNTRDSTEKFDFKPGAGKVGKGGMGKRGKGAGEKKGKPNRPGKSRRMAMRIR